MKYIDTIKVTKDRAVESGEPLEHCRPTVSCHLHFTLENLNRKSKDPVFYKMAVNDIFIVFSIRQFAQR
jgi:hypothetical protein